MICLFPDPYPDELLFSVYARYKDLMQYPNSAKARSDFFGSKTKSAVIDLPNSLGHLVSNLTLGHDYTVDDFIDNHTTFPFYAPFLAGDRARVIRSNMARSGENRISWHIGIRISNVPKPAWLRFCPICLQEDRLHFGETYWHRIHQLPGVEVCPHHAVFLEDSIAPCLISHNRREATSAEWSTHNTPARKLNLSNRFHSQLLSIARNTAWLMERGTTVFANNGLREHYYQCLLSRGLALYNEKLRTSKLISQFVDYYHPQILASLNCEIKNHASNWLLRLVHAGLSDVSQHPIRHILLILFLESTTEEFFTSYQKVTPFGDGPWPCLNRAAEHFGQLVIRECRIIDKTIRRKGSRPLGTFSCECGFIYSRVGPDKSKDDRYRISSVESRGLVWERLLRKVWKDTSISIEEAGRQLGVSSLTVIRHAIRLKIPMNIPSTRQISPKTIGRHKRFRMLREEALKFHRQHLRLVIKANPNAGRTELIALAGTTYQWLNKNDSEWLQATLPPVKKTNRHVIHKDWNNIDIKLATDVEASVKRIKAMAGRPARISLAEITKEVGHKSWLERCLHKLPLTAETLNGSVETFENFLIRRVQWTENSYSQSNSCPTRHQFEVHAGTLGRAGRTLLVQNAIEGALGRLHARFDILACGECD